MIETTLTTVDIQPAADSPVGITASVPSTTVVSVGEDGVVTINTVESSGVEVLAATPEIVNISVIQESAVVLTTDPTSETSVIVGADGVVYINTPLDSPVEITTTVQQAIVLEPVEHIAVVLSTPAQQGPAGPVGPIGPPGGTVTFTARQSLTEYTVLRLDTSGYLIPASCADRSSLGTIVGLTTKDYVSGDSVNVASTGLISNASWNFNSGQKVFVGDSGDLVQVLPADAVFLQSVGIMLSSNLMLINIESPIVIA